MWKEFKAFILRGNIFNMAVAFIMGLAFAPIVSSLVNDIIMPPIGMLLGKVDFANLFISLTGTKYASLAEAKAAGAPTINYGVFFNTIINFVIIAFVVFLLVKMVSNAMKKEEKVAVPTTKECPHCFTMIPIKASRCPNCTSELTTKKG